MDETLAISNKRLVRQDTILLVFTIYFAQYGVQQWIAYAYRGTQFFPENCAMELENWTVRSGVELCKVRQGKIDTEIAHKA